MPETTDGKKFDYSKLGMMKAKMHQQMLDKNKMGMGKKILDSIFTFKANDPNNTQNRVPPFNKEFWKKPYGRSSN